MNLISKAALVPFFFIFFIFFISKTLRFLVKLKITAMRKVRLISDSTKGLLFFQSILVKLMRTHKHRGIQ